MSGVNGDKSRFHRKRKHKIAQRERNRELFEASTNARKTAPSSAPAKPKTVSA